jgi:type IV pilus assembly protein PilN
MIKINLLVESRTEKVSRAPRVSFATAGLNNYIVLGALIVSFGIIGYLYYTLSSQLTALQEQVASSRREYEKLKPIIEMVQQFKEKNEKLKKKIDVINNLKANQQGPVRIMDEISKALPDLTWLTKLDVRGGSVNLTGQALNENAVANFVTNLRSSPYFREPEVKWRKDNNEVVSFDFVCTFNRAPVDAAAAAGPRS